MNQKSFFVVEIFLILKRIQSLFYHNHLCVCQLKRSGLFYFNPAYSLCWVIVILAILDQNQWASLLLHCQYPAGWSSQKTPHPHWPSYTHPFFAPSVVPLLYFYYPAKGDCRHSCQCPVLVCDVGMCGSVCFRSVSCQCPYGTYLLSFRWLRSSRLW